MTDALRGSARCAALLFSLGMDQASSLLAKLEPGEASRIISAARQLSDVDHDTLKAIIADFYKAMTGGSILPGEGAAFIQAALMRAGGELPGEEEAENPGLCPRADADSLGKMLKKEHPQTLALVMANIDPVRAASIVMMLSPSRRAEVIQRLARLSSVPTNVLRRIENTIESQLQQRSTESARPVKGIELAAGILKLIGSEDSNAVIEDIAKEDGELSQAVKQHLFTFDDIISMDDRGMRNLLKEIESQNLAKALKAADEGIRAKFFKNMSERAALMLEEDVENLAPMRLSEVEEAQQAIVDTASRLIKEGKAIVAGGAGGEVLV